MFSLGGALCEKLSDREANENDRLILFYSRWVVVRKVHYLPTLSEKSIIESLMQFRFVYSTFASVHTADLPKYIIIFRV